MHRTKEPGEGKGTVVLSILGGVIGNLFIPGIGGVTGAQIGAAIGAAAGAALDSYVIFPAIFPKPDVQGGNRFDQLNLTGIGYGGGVQTVYGRRARVAGQVIWVADELIEEKRRESSGGKGGSGQKIETHTYSTHVAVALCNNQLERLEAIHANDKVIWRYKGPQEHTFSTLRFHSKRRRSGRSQGRVSWIQTYIFDHTGSIEGKINFDELHSGQEFTITGATSARGANYNGTHEVLDTGVSGGIRYVSFRNENPPWFPQRVQKIDEFSANVTASWDEPFFNPSEVKDIRIYNGATDQVFDSLVAGTGVSAANAFRGTQYVVIEKLNLDRFGSTLPNFFFDCYEVDYRSVKEVSEIILLESLGDKDLYVTDDVEEEEVRGYVTSGIQTGEQKLGPLMLAYDLIPQEKDGRVHLFTRGSQPIHKIEAGDLAAHESGSDIPETLTFEDQGGFKPPDEVLLSYRKSQDLTETTIREKKRLDVISRVVSQVDLPLVMTEAQARKTNKSILWNAWKQDREVSFSLPPSYVQIRESECFEVTEEGQKYELIVLSSTRGANGIIECSAAILGVSQAPDDADDTDTIPTDLLEQPSSIEVELLDIPALNDRHSTVPGVYLAARNTNPSEPFRGAVLFSSVDDTDYEAIDVVRDESIMGRAVYDEPTDPVEITLQGVPLLETGHPWQESTQPGSEGAPDGTEWTVEGDSLSHIITFTFDINNNPEFLPGFEWEVHAKWTDRPSGRGKASIRVFGDEGSVYREFDQSLTKAQLDATIATATLQEGFIVLTDPLTNLPQRIPLGSGSGLARIYFFPSHSTEQAVVAIDSVKIVKAHDYLTPVTPHTWDRVNEITIELENGTLESVTEQQVYAGRNHAVLGDEIIAFQNAELVGENTWKISKLLRGLRNTEKFMGAHEQGDRFVMLDREDLVFLPLNFEGLNRTVYLKSVPSGKTLADIKEERHEISGTTMRPFSITELTAEQPLTGGPTTFRWKRRSKALNRVFGEEPAVIFPDEIFTFDNAGVVEETVKYTIEIRDAADDQLIRTVDVFDEVFVYTDGMKIADNIPIGGKNLRYEIYQRSRIVGGKGRGNSVSFEYLTKDET